MAAGRSVKVRRRISRGAQSQPSMVLAPATRLGPYQRPAPLGAGVDRFRGAQLAISADGTGIEASESQSAGEWPCAHSIKVSSRHFRVPGTAWSRSFPGANGSAFFADGKLKKIAVQGGEPVTLWPNCAAAGDGRLHPASAASGTDQKYYSSENASTLSRNGAHCNPNGKFAVEGKHAHIVYSGGNDRSMRVSLFWVSSRRYPSRCSAALAVRRSPSLIGSAERAPR